METPKESGIVISPTDVGGVIDAAFAITRRNFKQLVLVGAWAWVPAGVLSAIAELISPVAGFTASSSLTPEAASRILGPGMVLYILLAVISSMFIFMAYGALYLAFARIINPSDDPEALQPARLYKDVLGRIVPTIGLSLLFVLLVLPLIILFPLGIYLYVRWCNCFTAILVEKAGPIQALKRSWALTKGSWWHTFGVGLVTVIISVVISMLIAVPLALIAGVSAFAAEASRLTGVLASIASTVPNMIIAPFTIAFSIVLYYELRARVEGFDLTQRARQSTES